MIFTIIGSSLALLAAILNLIAFGFPTWTRNDQLARQLGLWSDCGLTFSSCQSWYRSTGSLPDWIKSAEVVLAIAIFFYLPVVFLGFFSSCICITKKFPPLVCAILCIIADCFLIAGTAVMATFSAKFLENQSPIKGATQLYWATWVSVGGIVLLFQAAIFFFIDLCWVRRAFRDRPSGYARSARDPLPSLPLSLAELDPDIKNLVSSQEDVPVDVYIKKMANGSTKRIHLVHVDDETEGRAEDRPPSRIRRVPSATSVSSMSRAGSRSSRSHSCSSYSHPNLPQLMMPPGMTTPTQGLQMMPMMPFGMTPQMPYGTTPQMSYMANPQMTSPVMMNPVFQLNPMMSSLYMGSPYQSAVQPAMSQVPLGYGLPSYPTIYVPESSCSCSSSSGSISSRGTGTS